jgi:hypothetical protein
MQTVHTVMSIALGLVPVHMVDLKAVHKGNSGRRYCKADEESGAGVRHAIAEAEVRCPAHIRCTEVDWARSQGLVKV